MKPPRFLRQKEVDIKLCHEHAERPRKLVPWWARARIAEPPAYARRSVVKASFSRNRRSGAWAAHARYLSRPGAQQEMTKGLGFDGEREDIDMLATVRDW